MTGFKTIFGNDLRTLALLRINVGGLVVYDLLNRSQYIYDHYSDQGVLPRIDLLNHIAAERFSLHLINGSVAFQTFLFILAILAGLALIAGYRTRLATIVSWVLLASLQNRNPILLQGGDNLLLLLLFWGMFLPLGARFSIDAALNKFTNQNNRYFSFATLGLALQCMSVYFFTVFLKSGAEYYPDGTAVYFALQLDILKTPVGAWLGQYYELTRWLTYFVLCVELAAPIFIFSPFYFVPIRLVVMAILFTMHLGFLLCLEIGFFPFVSWVTILSFTPSWVWDKLRAQIETPQRKAVKIYYDQDCGFCLKICLILRTFLLLSSTQIIPAQHHAAMRNLLQKHNSWIFMDYDGKAYVRWQAMHQMLKRSWNLWPLAPLMGISSFMNMGERIYEWVATHRPQLGRLSELALPFHHRRPSIPLWANITAALFTIYIIVFNISTLPQTSWRMPDYLWVMHNALRLDQIWNMFAPYPLKYDGWHIIRGKLRDGSVIELLTGTEGEPSWEKPEYASRLYENYRWRKYYLRTKKSNYSDHMLYHGRYLCRKWANPDNPDKELVAFRMYFNREVTLLNYKNEPIDRRMLWEHWCYDENDLRSFPKAP